MARQIPTVTIDDLRAFHAKHFPHATAPNHFLHGVEAETEAAEECYEEEDDGLGYYSDGAKRTLTDEQIAMFRHSEIQAILRKRKLRRDEGELSEDEYASMSPLPDFGSPVSLCINPITPDSATPPGEPTITPHEASDKVQTGRVQKPKTQQWATSSARTKAKTQKNNQKQRRKRKEERQRQRQKTEANAGGDTDESDEWDPWHQANGPDAQKNDTVDLDY